MKNDSKFKKTSTNKIFRQALKCIILFSFSNILYARMGPSDYVAITPSGNHIVNYYTESNMLILQDGARLDGLKEWWFYENHIIGRIEKRNIAKNTEFAYFAVNEITFKIDTFSTEKQWKEYLIEKTLEPKIWKRKYDGDWIFFDDTIILFIFLGFVVTIPLLILYLVMVYNAIWKEKFSFKKPNTIKVVSITLLLSIAWLLEQFPQNI